VTEWKNDRVGQLTKGNRKKQPRVDALERGTGQRQKKTEKKTTKRGTLCGQKKQGSETRGIDGRKKNPKKATFHSQGSGEEKSGKETQKLASVGRRKEKGC